MQFQDYVCLHRLPEFVETYTVRKSSHQAALQDTLNIFPRQKTGSPLC